jgi:hypothetical protein
MMRLLTALAALVILAPAPVLAGEEVAEELAKLRKEVEALRLQVAKLAAQKGEKSMLAGQLMAAAKKLKEEGKLADGSPELKLIATCLRAGGELTSRAQGLVDKLTPKQRGEIQAGVLCDVSVGYETRRAALRDLVELANETARAAIRKAIEAEKLLPAGQSAGFGIKPSLAVAAGDLKEKLAVALSIECLENFATAAARVAGRRRGGNRDWRSFYQTTVYGSTRTLVSRLRHWSGQETLGKYLQREGRWGYYRLDRAERIKEFRGELEKLKKWWKEKGEKFEFPKAVDPPGDVPPKEKKENPPPAERF